MTALGRSPASRAAAHARCRLAGSRLKLFSSTSANTGVAPTSAMTSAVAVKVKLGQITASPGPIPCAISTKISASVPLAHVTTWRAPQNSPAAAHARQGTMLEAADGDFEARHALLARHGWLPAVADRSDEGL